MSVEVQHLVKTYGTQQAVNDITFSVKKGEIVGFLGPNGAGKSTTMKIATCFIPPTTGAVNVCGYNVVEHPMEVRKRIGYLPEHNPLYTDMYIKEYLEFTGSLYGLKGKYLSQAVERMIEKTGLVPEMHKKVGQLSKGYRQRVGLAAAMIHNPEVLILDEPTTGLDPNQVVEIRNLIKEAGKEKTVILSTHIMQEVQMLCSRVVIINAGKIVTDNSIDKLTDATARKTFKIAVQFSGEVNAEELRKIENVQTINALNDNKFEIISLSDIRGEIFKLSSVNNWPLLEIKLEETSLEKVFQDLTGIK